MKWIILSLTVFFSPFVFSQGERPDRPEYLAQTRLLTVRVVPMDKKAKVFFAGQKMADIDFQKEHKVLEITALKSEASETLQFTKEGEAYVIPKLPEWNEPYDLVVKSQTKGKVENIKVRIENRKP